MRYIRTFKESISYSKYKNIEYYSYDILKPLYELGYDIVFDHIDDEIKLNITNLENKPLLWTNEIEFYFNNLRSYLISNGLYLTEVEYEKSNGIIEKEKYEDFIEKMQHHDINNTLYYFSIIFHADYFSTDYNNLLSNKDNDSLRYKNFDDLMESLNIWHDSLLSSIGAEEVNIFNMLKLDKINYSDNLSIEYLKDNIDFINSLSKKGLKKSELQNSEDFETFLNKPCKYMFIYDKMSNELENPEFLLFQVWNDSIKKWTDVKMYKVNNDVRKFYDRLTSRTIEIIDNEVNYIYQTSNGNEWILQNFESENDSYKKVLRRNEIKNLLNTKKVLVDII